MTVLTRRVRSETDDMALIVAMQKKTMNSNVAKLNALKRSAAKKNKQYVPNGKAWPCTNCAQSAAAGKSFGGCYLSANSKTSRCVRYERGNGACMDIPSVLMPLANNMFESKAEDWASERHTRTHTY